jgi:type VI secretion system protein ImpE
MVQTYREAIQCEALRAEIFAGKRAPADLRRAAALAGLLVEALKLDATDPDARRRKRASRPSRRRRRRSGSIDGTRLRLAGRCRQRLGPGAGSVVNGRYFWIPLSRIARIEIEPPADLRDAVWTAATFTWTNGAQTVGLIPTRYSGQRRGDDACCWRAAPSGSGERPVGQRMFVTDADDHPLMDARLIEFDERPRRRRQWLNWRRASGCSPRCSTA